MELGKNLIQICNDRNLTLSKLAKLSGIKQSTLHGWATGRAVHNLSDLKKVCDFLQISIHSLLFGTKDPNEDHSKEAFETLFKGDFRVTFERINKDDFL